MNNSGPSQPQQHNGAQQSPAYKGLVRPEQINQLPHLKDEEKAYWAKGTGSLWEAIAKNPAAHPSHQQALKKLRDVTAKLSEGFKAFQARQRARTDGMDGTPQQGGATRPPGQNHQAQNAQSSTQSQQPSQGSDGQALPQQEFPPHIKQKIDNMQWFTPPTVAEPEREKWRTEAKRRYGLALQKGESAMTQMRMLDQYQSQGKDLTDEMKAKKEQLQRNFAESKSFVETLSRQLQENRAAAGAAGGPQPGGSQQMQQPGSQARPPGSAPHAQTLNQQIRPSSSAATPTQGSQAPNAGQQYPQNFPQQRPQPSAVATQMGANTGHQNSPQTAGPQSGSGPPPAYTHQAAMAAAARSYTNPPQSTPQSATATPSGPNLMRGSNEPDRVNTNPNFRIQKNFNPPTPSPVAMGSARPTLTGASSGPMGMMGQPALQKQPTFLLQGPGDRVLDKKKLDELVRQVTGGAGLEGEALQPEVEESILQLADEFVDNVITNACKLAKLRGSSQLEIRDLQLIIERQYNIRIPGFASDEIRTVRKVQPAAPYLQKMQAVQAAKVMGGKIDT